VQDDGIVIEPNTMREYPDDRAPKSAENANSNDNARSGPSPEPVSDSRQMRFANRRDAGRRLAERLLPLADEDPVIIALPRGGAPVAEEVARALGAPLEVLAVRKLGAPHNPEYGIGAIAEDGTRVFDAEALAMLGIDGGMLESIVARESEELRRRVAAYRGDRAPLDLEGRTVIVVDDGVATGVTDTAALRAIRRRQPHRLILAVPVCAPDSASRLGEEADEVVCLLAPPLLYGVGQWYRDFSQVSDGEVISALLGTHTDAAA
jgi:putative phosphoribosyl transferase